MVSLIGSLPIKSIVKFFGVSIIILGLIFFGEGTYSLFSYNFSDNVNLDNSIPKIEFAKDRKSVV